MAIDFEEEWSKIQNGFVKFRRILGGEPLKFDFDELSSLTMAVDHIMFNTLEQDELYDRICQAIRDCSDQLADPVLSAEPDENMLKEIVKCWSKHEFVLDWVINAFNIDYLLNLLLPLKPKMKDVVYECFYDLVYTEIASNAKVVVRALINRDRGGGQIDRPLLKNFIDISVTMGVYEDDFESFILLDTTSYYFAKALEWSSSYSFSDYILKYKECLNEECDRVIHYLHDTATLKLVERVQLDLLVNPTEFLCNDFLIKDKIDDLNTMFMLCYEIPRGLVPLAKLFEQHVIDQEKFLVNQADNEARDKDFIISMLNLQEKWMAYVTERFEGHYLFHNALVNAFTALFEEKKAGSSGEELLAVHFHNILWNKERVKRSKEEIEAAIQSVLVLLHYISDTKSFFEFYRRMLAFRLLSYSGSDTVVERSILAQLAKTARYSLLSKFDSMTNEIDSSRENEHKFKEYMASINISTEVDLSITAIPGWKGIWPSYHTCRLNPPTEMASYFEAFETFYKREYEDRKISWDYSLGTCVISGNFDDKVVELLVSTDQAAVLTLFNNTDSLSFIDILEQVKLQNNSESRVLLRSLLATLSCGKHKILQKEPDTNSVHQTDIFKINSSFTCKRQRISLCSSPAANIEGSNFMVEAAEAALMKIMKEKRWMEQRALYYECSELLSPRFKLTSSIFKSRIEFLILHDFLERDPEDPEGLNYLPG